MKCKKCSNDVKMGNGLCENCKNVYLCKKCEKPHKFFTQKGICKNCWNKKQWENFIKGGK